MTNRLAQLRRETSGKDKDPVFTTVTGKALNKNNLYNRILVPIAISLGHFKIVTDENGKPKKRSTIGFHTFRHTCASLLFDDGKNIKQVQEWLGHSDPAFTLSTYVHLMDDGLGGADFFDQAVKPKPTKNTAPQPTKRRGGQS